VGARFSLPVGERAFIQSENILITLLEVEDPGCPEDVVCVTGPLQKVLINVTREGRDLGEHELTLDSEHADLAAKTFGQHCVRFTWLSRHQRSIIDREEYYAAGFIVLPVEELTSAFNRFGFDLFGELVNWDGRGENIFISPFSVSLALAMTYNGAATTTEQAMASTLHIEGMERQVANKAAAALLRFLDGLEHDVELSIANSLWARQGLPLEGDFLQRNTDYFGAEVASLDFGDPSARDAINQWVSDQTRGKIEEIVKEIKATDIMFLINAIYLSGPWQYPFEQEETTSGTFHLLDGSEKEHPMMSCEGTYMHYQGEGFQALKLPLRDSRIGVYVFLPDEDSSLPEFLSKLNSDDWESWMSRFELRHGPLVLPRFKFEYEALLNGALEALGMGEAFSPGADFSAMSPTNPWIDRVRHKTYVRVNEEGVEAAAATSVAVEAVSRPPPFEFIADRPFYFAIRDDNTKAILFMGAVFDPIE
jgi:serpin B